MIKMDEHGEWLDVGGERTEPDEDGCFQVLARKLRGVRLQDLPEGTLLGICDQVIGSRDTYRRSPYCTFERQSGGTFVAHVDIPLVPDDEVEDDTKAAFLEKAVSSARSRLETMKAVVENVEHSIYDDIAYIHFDLSLSDQPVLEAESYIATVEEQILDHTAKPLLLVCHATEDKPFVDRLVEELDRRALHAWYDKREILVGDSIVSRIESALAEIGFLVVVFSPRSVVKPWVQRELHSTLMRQLAKEDVVVLPVLLEECKIPPLLADIKYADFRHSFDGGMAELVAALRSK